MGPMSYDNWKTYSPDDDFDKQREAEAPCEETPKVDDYDVCLWCGADPTQACQFFKGR